MFKQLFFAVLILFSASAIQAQIVSKNAAGYVKLKEKAVQFTHTYLKVIQENNQESWEEMIEIPTLGWGTAIPCPG